MDELIKRINELAKKKKTVGLTPAELEEQAQLRKKYLENFRAGFKQRLENIDVETPDGKVRPLTDYKKKKSAGLTKEEAKEQIELRQQYLDKFREGFKQRLENIDVETPDGKVRPLTDFKKKNNDNIQ